VSRNPASWKTILMPWINFDSSLGLEAIVKIRIFLQAIEVVNPLICLSMAAKALLSDSQA
jgi:hypothetical protein